MGYGVNTIIEGRTLREWSKETGISVYTLIGRLKSGWSNEKTLHTKPVPFNQAAKKHDIINKIFRNNQGKEFLVSGVAFRDKYSVAHYAIKFLESGYETTATIAQIVEKPRGMVQDRLSPTVHGIGIMGFAYGKDNPKLFNVWRAMIARCYNPKNPSYKTYGSKGITVCDRWLRFDYFLEDVVSLPGFDQEAIDNGKLVMDKDTINRNLMMYCPESCCFITRSENTKESSIRTWKEKRCNDHP